MALVIDTIEGEMLFVVCQLRRYVIGSLSIRLFGGEGERGGREEREKRRKT